MPTTRARSSSGPRSSSVVEPVLLGQRVDHAAAAPARPADAPRAGLGGDGVLGVDGLVRTMEGAEAEVDDADLELARVDPRRPRAGRAEPHAAGSGGRAEPEAGRVELVHARQLVLVEVGHRLAARGRPLLELGGGVDGVHDAADRGLGEHVLEGGLRERALAAAGA